MADAGPINPGQVWRTDTYVGNAAFVADLGAPVVDLLAPRSGELILDRLRRRSPDRTHRGDRRPCDRRRCLVRSACRRACPAPDRGAGRRQALPFGPAFDAVFTNAALHWMKKPEAVIAGVRRALKSGGRFVGEFGGHGNVAAIVTALLAVLARRGIDGRARFPWYFPTPAEYRALLSAGGFAVREIALIPRPTPLPTGMQGWLGTFANPLLADLSAEARVAVIAEAVDLLAVSLRDDSGNWTADYVRLRFAATAV